jgi:hypothetical protein
MTSRAGISHHTRSDVALEDPSWCQKRNQGKVWPYEHTIIVTGLVLGRTLQACCCLQHCRNRTSTASASEITDDNVSSSFRRRALSDWCSHDWSSHRKTSSTSAHIDARFKELSRPFHVRKLYLQFLQPYGQLSKALAGSVGNRIADGRVGSDIAEFANAFDAGWMI